MIDTKSLCEMPSSLNDACRKLEIAADEIERLREALTSVRAEIDLRKSPKLMAKIEAALGVRTPGQAAR